MKTRLNSAKYTRLSKSKQSDQPCDPSVEVKKDKRQPYVISGGCDKLAIQETSTPKNKIKKPQKGVTLTPAGKDDLICSQHFDSQVVVGWDCQSPDSLRGIKRFSGSEQTDGVSDLLSRLIEEESDIVEIPKRSTPPLLGVWRENKTGKLSDNESGLQHRLRKRNHSRRKKDSDVSRDLLKNLTRALDKCSEDAESEEKEEKLDDNDNVATRSDVCPSIKPSPSSVAIHSVVSSATEAIDIKKKESTISDAVSNHTSILQSTNSEELFEDTWSDDDLFDEDSFIVKATQMPEKCTKFVSPVFGTKRKSSGDNYAPKSKTSRFTFQLDDGDINGSKTSYEKLTSVHSLQTCPPNVQGKSSKKDFFQAQKTKTNIINTKPPVFRPTVNSSTSSAINSRSSTLSSRPYNQPVSFTSSVMPKHSSSKIYQPKPVDSDSRGLLKKHNSFSGQNIPNLNATSRRRSVSGGNCSTMPSKPDVRNGWKSSVIRPNSNNNINRTNTSNSNITNKSVTPVYQNQTKLVTSCVNNSVNTSIASSEIKQLDKNCMSSSPADTVSSSGIQGFYKKKLNDSGFDTSISDDLLCQLAEPDDLLDSLVLESTICGKANVNVSKSNVDNKTNNQIISTSKCITEKVPMATSTIVGNKDAEGSDTLTKTSLPSAGDLGMNSEDLFSDDDYDDDGLTEPEVLAMLDEVELLATQQGASQKQQTLNYRTDRQEQCHTEMQGHIEVQGHCVGHSELNGSQESNSQKKYSQADIEKKKQDALARRKMKMKK